MTPANYKTVRLSRGRHGSADEGVCVMELSSMLAGEQFSDQPATVSPVIAAFLRAYNDAATEEQRQRLYRYATAALDTRAPRQLERARARMCLRRLQAIEPHTTRVARHVQLAVALVRPGLVAAALGRSASHADASSGTDDCLRLVDKLIELSRGRTESGGAAAPARELAGSPGIDPACPRW